MGFDVTLNERTDLAMIAIQGPKVKEIMSNIFKESADALLNLKPFHAIERGPYFIARTGYTGEDGFEVILPAKEVPTLWTTLLNAGVKPCGLGARDTLRLEAGLNLYGTDMDESVSPLESNLAWTVAWDPATRDFMGRDALEHQKKSGTERQLVGLI